MQRRVRLHSHAFVAYCHVKGLPQVFERFLLGETLEECYDAVAEVANRWLDMLDTQV